MGWRRTSSRTQQVDGLQLDPVAAEWLQRVCLKIKAEDGTFHLQQL